MPEAIEPPSNSCDQGLHPDDIQLRLVKLIGKDLSILFCQNANIYLLYLLYILASKCTILIKSIISHAPYDEHLSIKFHFFFF